MELSKEHQQIADRIIDILVSEKLTIREADAVLNKVLDVVKKPLRKDFSEIYESAVTR